MRNRIPSQRDAGTRLTTALRRRPFSAGNKGNRRRLHAGNTCSSAVYSRSVVNIVTLFPDLQLLFHLMILQCALTSYYCTNISCDLSLVHMNLANSCIIVGEKKINYIFVLECLISEYAFPVLF